ncbi:unnamed protein product [Arctia plantaginis]|uniref:Uncharacterized protein n=1 Tax=Arctia plantaginis TaxID=874455 RepID=A0A8S1BDI9_ARCPL|nr:unnamed protein product [Arctia plantaginis]
MLATKSNQRLSIDKNVNKLAHDTLPALMCCGRRGPGGPPQRTSTHRSNALTQAGAGCEQSSYKRRMSCSTGIDWCRQSLENSSEAAICAGGV